MVYSIRIQRSAAEELQRIPAADGQRVAAAIDDLARRPWRGRVLKGGLRGLRRVRVGRYRVIYEIQDETLIVLIVRFGARDRAYRAAVDASETGGAG